MSDVEIESSNAVDFAATGDLSEEERPLLHELIRGLCTIRCTESGLRNVPPIYAMAGRNLGARAARLFLYVLLPASLPHLLSGLKQGWAFAWRP